MVYRAYVQKRKEFAEAERALLEEIRKYIKPKGLLDLEILHRYDVQDISEADFEKALESIFSEPQVDRISALPKNLKGRMFGVEALPGQFDQRADSAAICIQLMSAKEKPQLKYAKIYVLHGDISDADFEKIKAYLINPVESCEADLYAPCESLSKQMPEAKKISFVEGFCDMDVKALQALLQDMHLAMDLDDILFVQDYFKKEKRNPTVSEIRVMDTYWSDHCRHTTFLTELKNIRIEDESVRKSFDEYMQMRENLGIRKPVCLMDMATVMAKSLKKEGGLLHLDESEEINACTLKIPVDTQNGEEDWLLLFKNETHNHPTEIEPFGGAATCIGGAIRDPLSARSYVYASMRISGAANPNTALADTIKGKLPQRKICQGAAEGFSSYGNQIGLATGCVREIYHEGYAAKRLEAGAVLGAAPLQNVRREAPLPGDAVLLIGGRTGRDGVGGATGSSKAHDKKSVDTCSAQVQKGNAPEERKLQRLFLNKEATRLIKRCNDFGAGGVSVAVGELADGLLIELDKVPKKYEGLDATELAISESQERMAVVVEEKDVERFIALCREENLEATQIAKVTEEKRMVMTFGGEKAVDLDRGFLSSNGAKKSADVHIEKQGDWQLRPTDDFAGEMRKLVLSLPMASQKGLLERFDSTIGAGTVLMPLGGKHQRSAPCAMAHSLPVEGGTETVSLMAYGYNPYISEKSPYHGAYLAVADSVAKLVAAGAKYQNCYLSFQEYFAKLGKNAQLWGRPTAALLGSIRAQKELSIAAIGGKDSMSGSFENISVPPTLISFAVSWDKRENVTSPEFKKAGSHLVWLRPENGKDGLPKAASMKHIFDSVSDLIRKKRVRSVSAVGDGGLAASIWNAALGNGIGARISGKISVREMFSYRYASFLLEMEDAGEWEKDIIGETIDSAEMIYQNTALSLETLYAENSAILEPVYQRRTEQKKAAPEALCFDAVPKKASVKIAKPRVLIPAFPGTNCEIDTKRAFERAGAVADILLIRNISPRDVEESVKEMAKRLQKAQILMIPGGFSGGDEPEGSAKLISAFLRNAAISEEIKTLLEERDGLIGGICNGFQALIKLGLLPDGRIRSAAKDSPTLTYNEIGRHQSGMVRVRCASKLSPWFLQSELGEIREIAISHGEGRFACDEKSYQELKQNGQIASQYVDAAGNPSMDIDYNPAGSYYAVEALTSKDGRVMGRMGHSERMLSGLYKNIPMQGQGHDKLFDSAVLYYR